MRDAAPQTIYLKDYVPFGWVVDKVQLTFQLAPENTHVLSRIEFRPNPDGSQEQFFLHGEELTLISARINGEPVTPTPVEGGVICDVPAGPFVWETEVSINPQANTALEGLYMSGGMYCTQCEAEGFRKITYYPDRPDVMAPFDVRIEGPQKVLLSNGNPTAKGCGWAEWSDPWPKPAYLFALVAGDLLNHPGKFTTCSGRDVELNIWVRPGDEHKCAFAMESLIKSMKWDEDVYSREYDLDVFNIVAVDDFNMGAMENKGLNIFNSSAVLASPKTSTDVNFERIEAIIAHEYFHNWTGNRITCRDWFQLCLKEGLTVFRDAQFTSDMRSAPVKRISDVADLRARQFREDNGPLAHPVRPESFVEINNFYTATVYEKGAELIGMLKTLVGEEIYYKALALYFDRHDGDAATIEDWLQVFEDVTGRNLSQFKRWYSQAGTPRLKVSEVFEEGTLTLTFEQSTPPTPGQPTKDPRVIPVAMGLLDTDGQEIQPTRILEITQARQSFSFSGFKTRPVPSLLRGFSAPVILEQDADHARCTFLLTHDTDPFNRWEAGRLLARDALTGMILTDAEPDPAYIKALHAVLQDEQQDPAFRALILTLPGQDELAQYLFDAGHIPDPQKIWQACIGMRQARACNLRDLMSDLHDRYQVTEPFSPGAAQAGRRALANGALSVLTLADGVDRAKQQFAGADNMTQQLSALSCLLDISAGKDELGQFYDQWQKDRLVIDKWFSLQVLHAAPDQAAQVARKLVAHPDFTLTNPNRFRAVLGGLVGNPAGFHHASGAGYEFVADMLLQLDPKNPQTTARMSTAFETWRRYDSDRQNLIRAQIDRMLTTPGLSRDTTEMLTRIRGD